MNWKRWVGYVLLGGTMIGPVAAEPPAAAARDIVFELFVRNDSDVCRQAVEVAEKFAGERQGLKVVACDVLADQEALRRYWQLVKQAGVTQPVMPGLAGCSQFKLGYTDEAGFRTALEELLTIRIFTREGCPHCRDAKRFLAELVTRIPALRVEEAEVVHDAAARRRMEQLAKEHAKRVTGLPVICCGGQLFVGYQTDDVSGRRIEALFNSPAPAPNKTGRLQLSPPQRSPSRRGAEAVARRLAVVALWKFAPWVATIQTAAPLSGDLPPPPPAGAPPPPPADIAPPPPPEYESAPSTGATASSETAQEIEIPYLGTIRLRDWGMPLFTLIIGLVDGFNPCAMWVLVFLLSVLVNVRNRVRMVAIAGTFVLISGLAYFSFMAAWLNIFMLLGVVRPLQIALGCVALCVGTLNVKDFFAFKRGASLSIPDSVKPGIYERVRHIVSARSLSVAVSAAVVLAVMVNVVELLCTAGLPALYSEILTMQNLPRWENYAYLALYNVAYMFDDTLLLVGFVITLSHRKLQEREGRWLKLVSGLVVLLLGAAMIFKPEWLHLN